MHQPFRRVASKLGVLPEAGVAPVMSLEPTERVNYTRTVTAPKFAALGVVIVVAGAVTIWVAPPAAGIVLAVAGLIVLHFASARLRIDSGGVRIGMGVLGRPGTSIDIDRISSATARRVSPAEFGGWGYRVFPGKTGVILRSGPGLVLTLRGGRLYAITLDDPGTPASLLNGLVERAQ